MKAALTKGALAAIACWVVACAGDQSKVNDPYMKPEERPKEQAIGEAPQCLDEKDKPVDCAEDKDCCEGFVCGIDPEVSHSVKHCIYNGK
jgi:hypothetical protein